MRLTTEGPSPLTRTLFAVGGWMVKAGAGAPAYNLSGLLYLSPSGYLLLSVPNALVRGVFAALHEPGAELPPSGSRGLNAHVTVMRPEELELLGGPDAVTERGKQFRYTLGRFVELEPEGWPEMSKAYLLKVHSPELQQLRRSYGLSGLPHEGRHEFGVICAVKRKGVLGRNAVGKGEANSDQAAVPRQG